jgi:uncharacterized Zn-binding protein involved in type VI secretion
MPGVARVGDAGQVHCSGFTMATGSPNVLINGRPAVRVGDLTTVHKKPDGEGCTPHVARVSAGSSSVFVNGRPLARIGDPIANCTKILQGSSDVIAD